MSQQANNLMLLLQLMEGRLSSGEGQAARRRLAEDQLLRRRWQQLTTAARQTEVIGPGDPDDIAAFLDGRGSDDELASFESRCWNSETLLAEVIACFRGESPTENATVSDELSNRLLNLGPAHNLSVEEPAAKVHGAQSSGESNGKSTFRSGPRYKPAGRRPDRNDRSAADRGAAAAKTGSRGVRNSQAARWSWILAGVVAMVFAIRVGFQFGQQDIGQIAEDDKTIGPDIVEDRNQHTPPLPQNDNNLPRNRTPEDSIARDDTPRTESVEPNRSPGPNEPDSSNSPIVANDPAADQPLPKPNLPEMRPPEPQPSPPMVAWSRIDGIVGGFHLNKRIWQGVKSPALDANTDRFQTLHGSRADGRYRNRFDFVMGPATDLQWAGTAQSALSNESATSLILEHGRVLVKSPAQSEFNVTFGRNRTDSVVWKVMTSRDADFELRWQNSAPTILVSGGSVEVNGRRIGSQRMMVHTGRPRPPAQSIPKKTAWLIDYVPEFVLDPQQQNALLTSSSLAADVDRLVRRFPGGSLERRLALFSSLEVNPASIVTWLNQNHKPTRAVAREWLELAPDNSQRADAAWAAIAQEIAQPAVARSMRGWLNDLRTRARLDWSAFGPMVRNLSNSHLIVRDFAIAVLRRWHPDVRVAFDPDADPKRRAQDDARKNWLSALRRKQQGR